MNPVSLMANAEKLSVAQLQQAVKNGTVPAYIGIPMMQEKMKQAKQAQVAQAPTEPPIAQQVMAEASGIDQMPSNLPVSTAKEGGIVAFANGGDVEDQEAYEDQRDEAEYAQAIEDRLNAAEQGGRSAAPNTAPVASSANINSTPNVEGGIRGVVNQAANKYGLPPELLQRISGSESGHNPRAKNSASSAEGLFQFIPSTWAGMGGKPGEQSDPVKNADLGGKFIRQNAETLKRQLGRNPNYDEVYAAHYFGPGVTAMLKNATPDMPIEQGLRMFNSEKFVPIIMQQNPNLRGKTVGQVMGSLREKMGDGQVSLAEGGIARLNKGGVARFAKDGLVNGQTTEEIADSAEENRAQAQSYEDHYINSIFKSYPDPATLYPEKSPDKERYSFDNPLSSRMIYKSNPKVTEEERLKYIKHALNFGPEIAGASNERSDRLLPPGVTLPNVPAATSIPSASQSPPMQAPFDYEYGKGASLPIETKTGAGVNTPKDTDSGNGSSSSAGNSSRGGERQKSEYDLIREDIMNQREELKRQKQEDKYMAILQAGLGMMGGTSPNAFANIGQGASAGIAQYSQSAKQRAAENAALNKGLITAQRYKGMDDYQRAALASRESYQDRMLGDKSEANAERLGLKQEELERLREKDIGTLINNGSARATAELKAKFPNPDLLSDKDKIAYKQEEANLYAKYVAPFITVQNQMLQKRYPEYFKDDSSVRPAPTGGNRIRVDAKGNVIN
jgi:soluble lytic murein transglycosylase-like protein